MSTRLIDAKEVEFSPLSMADASGRVFFWKGRVFRGVSAAAAGEMRERFESGLVGALVEARLLVRSWISDLGLEPFEIVIEHERMPVVTFPYEWSYGMLRAAAACVLEVNEVANRHGWELKDCHGFNVLFDGPRPRYVDLGSLTRRTPGARGWSAYEEFVRFYEYPLRIWSDGNGFIARRLLAMSDHTPHENYLLYRRPLLRTLGGAGVLGRWMRRWYQFRRLSGISPEKLRAMLTGRHARIALWLAQRTWLPLQTVNLARLRRRVLARERRWLGSTWSGYQVGWNDEPPSPRFRRILEIVRELQAGSVLELGGNQGWLARQLCDVIAGSVICTDADEEAVDRAHLAAATDRHTMHTAVLDFVYPQVSSFGLSPQSRIRGDLVLALAVSHHILLSQQVAIGRFFEAVRGFADRYVMIEFMPLGLWNGKVSPPLPSWYNVQWFRDEFCRHFTLLREERLEENRVLFVGSIAAGPTAAAPNQVAELQPSVAPQGECA